MYSLWHTVLFIYGLLTEQISYNNLMSDVFDFIKLLEPTRVFSSCCEIDYLPKMISMSDLIQKSEISIKVISIITHWSIIFLVKLINFCMQLSRCFIFPAEIWHGVEEVWPMFHSQPKITWYLYNVTGQGLVSLTFFYRNSNTMETSPCHNSVAGHMPRQHSCRAMCKIL